MRQCPDRYTIRAGRNLPDKEFRYLRTVIVTAAIHQGLNSMLRSEELTSPFDLLALGRLHTLYFVLDDFAKCCVFVKQSPGPFLCGHLPLLNAKLITENGSPSPEVTGIICRVP